MKKLLVLIVFSTLCGSAFGQMAIERIGELSESFIAPTPGESELRAYEKRAEQKINEFFEISALLTDSSLDKELRAHLESQAEELFYDSSCVIATTDLSTYLEITKFALVPKGDMRIEKELTPLDNGDFVGEVYVPIGKEMKVQVGIILAKTEVIFGDQSQILWKVFLCDIY